MSKRQKENVPTPQCSIFPLKAARGWGQRTCSTDGGMTLLLRSLQIGLIPSMDPGTRGREEGRGSSGEKWTQSEKRVSPKTPDWEVLAEVLLDAAA